MTTKYWIGKMGAKDGHCDICSSPFNGTMFDASLRGCWGCFCRKCFDIYGMRLGTGLGQKYREKEGKYYLVAGGQDVAE